MEITEQNLQAQVQAALMTILAPAASANVDIDGVVIRIVNSVGSTFAYVPIATILSGTLSGYLKSDKLQTMTEAEYDALVTKYADTYYFTYEDDGEGGDGDEGEDSGDGGGSDGDVDVYWGTPENNMVSLTVGDTTYTLCLVGHKHSAADITDLATVASTGSYNDLTDKPNFDPTNYVDTVSDQRIGGHKTFVGSLDIGSTLVLEQAGEISYNTDNDSFTFTVHGADMAVLDSGGLYVDGDIKISSDDFSAIVNATDGTLQQALDAKLPITGGTTTGPIVVGEMNGQLISTARTIIDHEYVRIDNGLFGSNLRKAELNSDKIKYSVSSDTYDLTFPAASGTIALTSDITAALGDIETLLAAI